jgi:hypothetical protein
MAAFYTLLYIAAPVDAEAIACDESAADRWPSLWLRHIGDQELVALWGLVAKPPEASGETLMADLLFQGSDEGPFVIQMPAAFVSAVAALPAERVSEVAALWGRTTDPVRWRPEDLAGVLGDLWDFAARAVACGKVVVQVAHL